MKLTMMGVAAVGLTGLLPVGAHAESKDLPRPANAAPILQIVTYDTGYGTASASYFFGRPITGSVRFRTVGDRDTRGEGYGKRRGRY